jgi:drug/metabolite transporter (DMT)-like permease
MVVYVLLGALGNVLLSHGMRQMPPVTGFNTSEVVRFFRYLFTTPSVVAAVACMAADFVIVLLALSWADMSVVIPATAGDYLLTAALARWALHEQIPAARWLGVSLVTLGVIMCLATSKPSEQKAASTPEPSVKVGDALAAPAREEVLAPRPVRAPSGG